MTRHEKNYIRHIIWESTYLEKVAMNFRAELIRSKHFCCSLRTVDGKMVKEDKR